MSLFELAELMREFFGVPFNPSLNFERKIIVGWCV